MFSLNMLLGITSPIAGLVTWVYWFGWTWISWLLADRMAARKLKPPASVTAQEFTLDQILLLKESVGKEVNAIETGKQKIIDQGARDGKTLSTENVLKRVEEIGSAYAGPDREEYVRELDRLMAEFLEKYGPEIPVDEAYRIVKEFEGKHGPV